MVVPAQDYYVTLNPWEDSPLTCIIATIDFGMSELNRATAAAEVAIIVAIICTRGPRYSACNSHRSISVGSGRLDYSYIDSVTEELHTD